MAYSVSASPNPVDENAGTVTFTIMRSGSFPAETVYATTLSGEISGYATNSGDYADVNAVPVSFASGEGSKTVTLSITDDTEVEPDETFGFIIDAPDLSSSLAKTNWTIRDDDTAEPISFAVRNAIAIQFVIENDTVRGEVEDLLIKMGAESLGPIASATAKFYLYLENAKESLDQFDGTLTSAYIAFSNVFLKGFIFVFGDMTPIGKIIEYPLDLVKIALAASTAYIYGFIWAGDNIPPVEPQSTLPVGTGESATITTEFLLSTDNISGPDAVTYRIVRAPTHGALLLDGIATTAFTQADIDAGRVQYSQNGDTATSDGFVFTVSDAAGNWIGPEPFTIAIVDTAGPVVFENDSVTLPAGGRFLIWKDVLSTVALGSDPDEIVYNVTAGPTHGMLVIDGAPVASFTQADIDTGRLGYAHNGDAAATDSFTFTATDRNGVQTAVQTFSLTVGASETPAADPAVDAPIVLGAVGPEWEFGGALVLDDGNFGYLLRNSGDVLPGALQVGEVVDGAPVFTDIGGIGAEWELAGTGDFSGDGRSDFLMRNSGDLLSGALYVGEIVEGRAVYTDIGGIGPEWELAGTGDFSGNGRSDFLIRNTGDVIGGRLEVGEVVGDMLTFTDIGEVGGGWEFVGTGDYLNGAATDFLMRDTASGTLMVGSTVAGVVSFTTFDEAFNMRG